MITRRAILKGLLGATLAGLFTSAYAFFVEPALRLRVRRWRLRPEAWQAGPLKIAVIGDLHMGGPWVTLPRLERIVTRTNALGADVIVFLGDLEAGHRFVTDPVRPEDAAAVMARLSAPLGVWAILGNHDWWHDGEAQRHGQGPTRVQRALEAAGIPVLENRAIRIARAGQPFWLAGLGDQLALARGGGWAGVDDLPATLAEATGPEPVILLAHEPDIFPAVPDRVCLTLSGHTHGGQVRLFGWSPVVPSRFGNRYAYGHVREGGRDLVVTGGVGCSILPIRLGVVPEITLVELE
ncbi:metallophosphoesterase [Albidovulum sediminicola]|uniref:Metallophosphoesterase n=1 Tax=Albidovulum sediminicola TaxID=2984331 RepID=A0ABT2Z3Z7_9RHOB|nr:metallophosphoesterase [Defluviimonas sp. WL0075]MCV2865853.1 metallophosphoesterase [Defluviimonas sp. WL0075]